MGARHASSVPSVRPITSTNPGCCLHRNSSHRGGACRRHGVIFPIRIFHLLGHAAKFELGNGPHLRAAASATARPNSPAEGMLPASRPPGAAGRLSGGGSGCTIPPRRALKSAGRPRCRTAIQDGRATGSRPSDSCATACPAPLVSFSAALQLQYFRRLLVKWNDNQRAAGSRMV